MPVKLYLDEDVLPSLAPLLRGRGFDAISAHEFGRLGLSDEDQLVYATQQGRVLVSYNVRDYIRLARTWFDSGMEHAGIVLGYRQFSKEHINEVAGALLRMLNTIAAEDMRNTVRYIQEFLP